MAVISPNHRLDAAGRLLIKYKDNQALRACWDAALTAGVDPEDCRPEGATDPRIRVPQDSIWSELILRAFEAAYGKPSANDPFPALGFKANLRVIAFNLDLAAKLLTEAYHAESVTPVLIPLEWLKLRAELGWLRSGPGSPNPLAEIDREMRAEGNRYPYLSVLWCAWYPEFISAPVVDLGWS
jgi:hypothetical protein